LNWDKLRFWKHGFIDVRMRLAEDELKGVKLLPDSSLIFRAFESTPFDKVRVVILGQDPYHTPGMAHGLAFSVPSNVSNIPSSLRNIFSEYVTDLGLPPPRNGNLSAWSEKGVLLLNTVLTVEAGKPNSHANIGWEKLTYEVIRMLSTERNGIVFLLWGKQAEAYKGAIDETRHLVICSGHPSSLARGAKVPFLGSKPFSRTCEYLGVSKDFWRL
jgi:uracil-DNA glycosylase